ncbi:MAG: hypothetical protein L0I24_15805, partial [Pseudonocardia sp.]|nr:hypothetical protein [Pseudonocardia sp.]
MIATSRPLRILHRSYGGDNTKPRPAYYSKLLALAAMLRAADALDVAPELVFINDGPMPDERLRVMERFGEVRWVRRGGSDANSYREMLADENARAGQPDDLIWLAEDDYLYVPDALRQLVAGAAATDADYFTLYGSRAIDAERSGRTAVLRPEPAAEGTGQAVEVGAQRDQPPWLIGPEVDEEPAPPEPADGEAGRLEPVRDDARGAHLSAPELGVGVQVATDRDELVREVGDGVRDGIEGREGG